MKMHIPSLMVEVLGETTREAGLRLLLIFIYKSRLGNMGNNKPLDHLR